MKATEQDILKFMVGWANTAQSFQNDLDSFKAAILSDIKEHDFQNIHDFEDFGKQAFLHRMVQFWNHNEPIERAVRETKDILNR